MRTRRFDSLVWLIAAVLLASTARGQAPATSFTSPSSTRPASFSVSTTDLARRSDGAIQRGVRYLLSQQRGDGGWVEPRTSGRGIGNTALATLALLSCGESPQSPAIQQALDYLKKSDPSDYREAVYATALRACAYAQLPQAMRERELRADMQWLQRRLMTGQRRGMYNYGNQGTGDYSNSQYGVLGVWAAAEAGLDVPLSYWRNVEAGWLMGQNADGGWGYRPAQGSSYSSMTVAAAATLFITNDYLHARDYQDLARRQTNAPLGAAIDWIAANFAVERNAGLDRSAPNRVDVDDITDLPPSDQGRWIHYMLFGFERVGEASGLTRFGEHRWYDRGADFLIRTQQYEGNWIGDRYVGPVGNSSYALLFLSRGRAPVVAQKLEFGERWNNRPRDLSGFSRFMRRATERHVNWQIVPIGAAPEEFRDAPLLYIASDRPVELDERGKASIRRYIEQGGLLVAANEGRNDLFNQSIIALAKDLFPQYSFREAPKNHDIYAANFPVISTTTPIRALSNGLRELIVLFPGGDMPWQWHSAGGFNPRSTPYAPLANLWLYATDRANPRFKGEGTWVDRNPNATVSRTVRIARIRYGGNWDPEPGGWVRLSNIMANFDQTDLQIEPADASIPSAAALAHLTATRGIVPTNERRAMIKAYLDGGGLLLMDAAGGSSEAPASFEQLLKDLFPDVVIAPLPLTHPIYRAGAFGGFDIDSVEYRRVPNAPVVRIARLRGATVNGKLIAILSNEDLSGALVGYAHSGLVGYTPASAADIMRNLILWRAAAK